MGSVARQLDVPYVVEGGFGAGDEEKGETWVDEAGSQPCRIGTRYPSHGTANAPDASLMQGRSSEGRCGQLSCRTGVTALIPPSPYLWTVAANVLNMILRSELLLWWPVLVTSAWAAETRASESSRPRGVGPECKNKVLTLETASFVGYKSFRCSLCWSIRSLTSVSSSSCQIL